MSIEIEKPTNGGVTLDLSYDDAEILCRALGMVNAGNLSTVSEDLSDIMDELLNEFGRNITKERRRYTAELRGVNHKQVYIIDHRGINDCQ